MKIGGLVLMLTAGKEQGSKKVEVQVESVEVKVELVVEPGSLEVSGDYIGSRLC